MIRPGLVRVRGRSMEPTLRDGQLLVVLYGRRARPGDVVLVDLPPDADGRSRPRAVKRLAGPDPQAPERLWIERDNPREGVDSWSIGSLPRSALVAVVLMRRDRT
ncbi:hypothetical protein GCM10027055_16210 [Janibacter alkaliphilus]